jgi:threonine-phosphate decarboxylase
LERYEHGGDIYGNIGVILDFSVSTNPFGLPDTVREALVTRVDEFVNYPDPLCRELCNAIASFESVQNDWVMCGNGAADLVYRLCFAVKPRRALVCAPTFSEYERALEQIGSEVIYHELKAENGFEITEELLRCIDPSIDMLFLCHPNNPTGRLISCELIKRIMCRARQTGTIVLVDECFLGFTTGKSAKQLLADTPELCVLKAFTKIYAMAGLRLGYILCSDKALLQKINAAAQCWSVSVPAQIAGIAALNCENWQKRTLDLIEEERHFLSDSMEKMGIKVFQSDANYLLLRSEYPLHKMLLDKGILIRSCVNFKGLDESFYRIGIKTRHENSCLIHALEDLLYG